MKILCVGDIVGNVGKRALKSFLPDFLKMNKMDLIIANAENVTNGRGISKRDYDELSGYIDGFTLGNHAWGVSDVNSLLEDRPNIIRPANFTGVQPGDGSMLLTTRSGYSVGVINLIGRTFMNPAESPFDVANREIKRLKEMTDIILVDFHAEATSEKYALGRFLNGKVSAVFGTHTHVQTADEQILSGGTGFITDLGMTGPRDSILGMKNEIILDRFVNSMPGKFELAVGEGQVNACVFTVNEHGKCLGVERIND